MGVGKYFNFKYIAEGFYSIAKGMSTFNLNPPKKSADEIINENNKEIKRKYGVNIKSSNKEAIKQDWQKVCNELGKNLENLIFHK